MNSYYGVRRPSQFAKPNTEQLRKLIDKDARIIGLAIEHDGVFIFTDRNHWVDQFGNGTFRADNEAEVVKLFNQNVQSLREFYEKKLRNEPERYTNYGADEPEDIEELISRHQTAWHSEEADFLPPTRQELDFIKKYLPKSERPDFKNASEAGRRDWLETRGYSQRFSQDWPTHRILLELAAFEERLQKQQEEKRSDKKVGLIFYALMAAIFVGALLFGR